MADGRSTLLARCLGTRGGADRPVQVHAQFEGQSYDLSTGLLAIPSFYRGEPVVLELHQRRALGLGTAVLGKVSTTLGEIASRQESAMAAAGVTMVRRATPAAERSSGYSSVSLPLQCEFCQSWYSSPARMNAHVVSDHWGEVVASGRDLTGLRSDPTTSEQLKRKERFAELEATLDLAELAAEPQFQPFIEWWPMTGGGEARLELWLVGSSLSTCTSGPHELSALHTACLRWRPHVIASLNSVGFSEISVVGGTRLMPIDLLLAQGCKGEWSEAETELLVQDAQRLWASRSGGDGRPNVLHYAIAGGNPALVRLVCSPALMVATPEGTALSPLSAAARDGAQELVATMLEQLRDVELSLTQIWRSAIPEGERSALAWAAAGGHNEVALQLLAATLPYQLAPDAEGDTALHLAALHCRADVVEGILSLGTAQTQNLKGETPLHLAAARGDEGVVRALLATVRDSRYLWMALGRDQRGRSLLDLAAPHPGVLALLQRELGAHFASSKAPKERQPSPFDEDVLYEYGGLQRPPSPSPPPRPPMLRRQVSYTVMDSSDVAEGRVADVREFATAADLPVSLVAPLLWSYLWDKDRLMEAWTADPEGTLAASKLSAAPVTESTGECLACMDDTTALLSLGCEHGLCAECWRQHLGVVLSTLGPRAAHNTTCSVCDVKMDDSAWAVLASEEQQERYDRYVLRSYVQLQSDMVWCPASGCDRVIVYSGTKLDVECVCGARVCFLCEQPAHSPASCVQMERWAEEGNKDVASLAFLLNNTKRCPRCKVWYEKNGGCNHITCSCGHQYCFLCSRDYPCGGGIECRGISEIEWNLQHVREGEGEVSSLDEGERVRQQAARWEVYFDAFRSSAQAEEVLQKRASLPVSPTEGSEEGGTASVRLALVELAEVHRALRFYGVCVYDKVTVAAEREREGGGGVGSDEEREAALLVYQFQELQRYVAALDEMLVPGVLTPGSEVAHLVNVVRRYSEGLRAAVA